MSMAFDFSQAAPIRGIAAVSAGWGVRLVARVIRYLAFEGQFDQPVRQILHQPLFAENLLGLLAFWQLIG